MSYLELRKTIGVIGLIFPFILLIGGIVFSREFSVKASISDYYYSPVRDVFVGFLISIALFLYSYKFEKEDNIAGNLAGIFAAGVALFPCDSSYSFVKTTHFVSAGLLFITLAYFCIFLFTKTGSPATMTKRKLLRNRIYRTCGFVMISCILVLLVYFLAKIDLSGFSFVFWFESIALIAFGISWLVKGGAIMEDKV
ncbi:MAG: DUF998 domain-containing protein [Bacteroidota bacterium]